MKNKFLILLNVLLVLFFYISCKETTNKTTANGKPIEKISTTQLNFIGHWVDEGKKEKLILELMNEFEFTHQEINLNMKWAEKFYIDPKVDNSEGKFNAKNLKSEKPEWDIIRLNNAMWSIDNILKQTEPDWAKKYLVDFSQIEEFKKNTKPELLTDELKAQYGGICPGPFIDGYNWYLWVNTEVAKKVGIQVKQFDMTNIDFANYLKAVYEYNKKNHDSIIGVFEANSWKTSHAIAEMLFFSELGNYDLIKDHTYSEIKIKAWEKVLKELEIYSTFKPYPTNWEKLIWINCMSYPLDNKCLFYSNATWMYNIWLKTDSSKLKFIMPVELPVFKPSPVTFGGYNCTWAVPKNAPHKDEAIKFLLFLNRPEVAEKWIRYTKSPSGIKGNLTSISFGLDKFENFQYYIEKKFGNRKVETNSYCFGKENEMVLNHIEDVFSGKMDAQTAMNDIRRSIKYKK